MAACLPIHRCELGNHFRLQPTHFCSCSMLCHQWQGFGHKHLGHHITHSSVQILFAKWQFTPWGGPKNPTKSVKKTPNSNISKFTSCNCHWYRKQTAFLPSCPSLLKPVQLQNKDSILSHLIEERKYCPSNEEEKSWCSAWEESYQSGQGSSQKALGILFPMNKSTETCVWVCLWGLCKRAVAGRLHPGLLQASNTH